MKCGAFGMISKANDKSGMETADIPMTQEGLYVEITNEGNAHHFLQFTLNLAHKTSHSNLLCGNTEVVT
jgi:hypothetical protein